MACVRLENIQKMYPGGAQAVRDFNLEIADKEFVVFVGPSGSGKSTTLRMIAGLEAISGGSLYIGYPETLSHSRRVLTIAHIWSRRLCWASGRRIFC